MCKFHTVSAGEWDKINYFQFYVFCLIYVTLLSTISRNFNIQPIGLLKPCLYNILSPEIDHIKSYQ